MEAPRLETDCGRGLRIKIAGIGGAGIKTLGRLAKKGLRIGSYVALDGDSLSLSIAEAPFKTLIGDKGQGFDGDMDIAGYYTSEKTKDIRFTFRGADAVVACCGLGGGTGSAAMPVVLREAKRAGALSIAVFTSPMPGSAGKKFDNAKKAFKEIITAADAYIVVPNDCAGLMGLSLDRCEAILRADALVDETVAGICSMLESEWRERGGLLAKEGFFLENAGACVVNVNFAENPGKALEVFADSLKQVPMANVPLCGLSRLGINIRAGIGCDKEALKNAVAEIVKGYFEQDVKIKIVSNTDAFFGKASVEISSAAAGLRRNPYYIAERRFEDVKTA